SQESYINDNSESPQDLVKKVLVNKNISEQDKNNLEKVKSDDAYLMTTVLSQEFPIRNQIEDHDEKPPITENQKLVVEIDEPIKENKDIKAQSERIANDLDPQESCGLTMNNCQSTSFKENYIDKDPDLRANKTLGPFSELKMDEFLRVKKVNNSFSEFQPLDESYDETSRYKRAQTNHTTRSKALQDNFIPKKPRVVKSSQKIENFNVSSEESNNKCISSEESKSLEISNDKTKGFNLNKLYSEARKMLDPRKQRKQKVTLVNEVYERDTFAEDTDTS
ncbi:7485_t:CDS:2, partial [Racocetra fulgida]